MNDLQHDTDLIRALVEYSGLKRAALAKRAGVAVTTINRPFNGTSPSRLGRSVLEKLQVAFPGFPGWEDIPVPSIAAERRLAFHGAEPERDPDLVELDEINLRYGLGGTYLDGPVSGEKRLFSRAWLRNFTQTSPQHLFWAIGDGDSMEPTIRSGEVVLIDASQTTPRMNDCIWAVALGPVGSIKRVRFLGEGRVELRSDSVHEKEPIKVGEDELHIVGRVVAVVRKL